MLSKSLKDKLSGSSDNNETTKTTNFKKIKLSAKSNKRRDINNMFIPTDLSMIKSDTPNTIPKIDIKSPDTSVKSPDTPIKSPDTPIKSPDTLVKSSDIKPNVSKKHKKSSKRRLSRRKKTTKNKTISFDLNNNSKKEKDIIELIDKFEKMDVKEIKTFLKNKGIESKKNNKSKLLPYLYLLTCVDNDINIIKSN